MMHYKNILINKLQASGLVQQAGTPTLFEAIEPHAFIERFINDKIKTFSFSVSALNAFLQCPLKFYYLYIVGLPSPKTESTSFGSAIHFALENYFRNMLTHPQRKFGDIVLIIEFFKKYMQAEREVFSPENYASKLAYGEAVLHRYYSYYIHSWNKVVLIEKFFRGVEIATVPVKGKIDKIEFNGNLATIIDYKSGSHSGIHTSLLPPNDEQTIGGNYWRQAVFYKLLVEAASAQKWQVASVMYDFVEPTTEGYFITKALKITEDECCVVREQLAGAFTIVQRQEFFDGCGKETCPWCNLAKNDVFVLAKKPTVL